MGDDKYSLGDYEWKLTIEPGHKGGPGSGNWGHAGRPGQVGGSTPGGGLGRIGTGPGSSVEERQGAAGRYREGRSAAAAVRAAVGQLKTEHDAKVKVWREERRRILDAGADLWEQHAMALGTDDEHRLAMALDENFKESNKILNKVIRAEKALARKVRREILYVDNPAEVGLSISSDISKTQAKAIERGVSEFEKMVGTGTVDGYRVYCDRKEGDRATCGWDAHLNLTSGARERTVIHEMGHWLEMNDRAIQRKAINFLNYRTKGEEARWLGDDYDKHEIAKRDKFGSAYSGKIYAQTGPYAATEIMSTGLADMWDDPVGFAQTDPEFFDFVYNTVRGR